MTDAETRLSEDLHVSLRYLSGKVSRHIIASSQTVACVRTAAAQESGLKSLRLVLKGKELSDDGQALSEVLADHDVVLVLPERRVPAPAFVSGVLTTDSAASGGGDEAGDDEYSDADLTRPPPDASALQLRVGRWLAEEARAQPALMAWFWLTRPWMWFGLAAWMVCAPLAARYASGTLYVLLTVLALMLGNLGTRRAGDASAYSVFNPNAEALPGQLGAEHVDGAIRGAAAPILF